MSVEINLPFPIRNQGGINACVAIALADACAWALLQAGETDFKTGASAMFLHFTARRALGQVNRNLGVPPKAAIDALRAKGVCPEPSYPNTTTDFRATPPPGAFDRAQKFRDWRVEALSQTTDAFVTELQNGHPILACLRLAPNQHAALFSAKGDGDGHIPDPIGTAIFNHAMLRVGYEPTTDCFRFRNSLGPNRGADGHAIVPAQVLMSKTWAYGCHWVHWDG